MAAAEYFSNASMSHGAPPPYQQQAQAPTSHPSYNQSLPQIQTPPQQNNQNSNVHFAPRPVDIPQRHSFSGQQRPSLSHQGSPQRPYYHNINPYQQQNQQLALQRPPQQFGSPQSSGYNSPPQRPQHLAPHMRPYANPSFSHSSLDQGYSSDPEPHRRKHYHKKRRESEGTREIGGKSRSKNTDAFLGAAGGGLIGDLIFPGLGTVGGAAIGWLGGKDYGRHRQKREEERAAAQKEWEAIHRPNKHHRDRSHDYSSRGSSNNPGPGSRQRSYERRKDDY